MPYDAKILLDSQAPCGARLTTFLIEIPKFIQAELNTHRMLSRNSASTRAVPAAKMRQRAIDDPVLPVFWGKNQKGMEAAEELSAEAEEIERGGGYIPSPRQQAREAWLKGRDAAVELARLLSEDLGLHKQIANRVLEPWLFVPVIVSATEWENFFRLRCHPAAQPEFRVVAEMMKKLYDASKPKQLQVGEWHVPWIQDDDYKEPGMSKRDSMGGDYRRKVSVARCARLSYLTHEGKRDFSLDMALAEKLAADGHWSPFEHVAKALSIKQRVGNFIGWKQLRADLDPHFQW